MIAVLQCLQRLSASPVITPTLLCTPDGIARIFSALLCGHDHVATEAARFLTRLWAPSPSRMGLGPWKLTRAGLLEDSDPASTASNEDNQNARSAKSICLAPTSRRCPALLRPLSREPRASQLVSMAIVEAVGSLICDPGSRTTDPAIFKTMLELCSSLGRPLFGLFSHSAGRVCDGAAVVMRSVAECGAVAAAPMRDAALREGALLHHLNVALFGKGSRNTLSRELVALWADQFPPALDLLERIFPNGLILFLNSPLPVLKKLTLATTPRPRTPMEESKNDPHELSKEPEIHEEEPKMESQDQSSAHHSPQASQSGDPFEGGETKPFEASKEESETSKAPQTGDPTVDSASKTEETEKPPSDVQELKSEDFPLQTQSPPHLSALANNLKGNWEVFWSNATRDHCTAGLIWNERTRSELREALEAEEKELTLGRTRVAEGLGGYPSWNFKEFEVHYKSLERFLCIGGIYVKLLLENIEQGTIPPLSFSDCVLGSIENLICPKDFFNALYHRFLCEADESIHLELIASSRRSSVDDEKTTISAFVEGDPTYERELCISAMASVYSVHAGKAIKNISSKAWHSF